MKILYLCSLLMIVAFVSCRPAGHADRLEEADRLLDDYPDSALSILKSIPPESLREEVQARLSLLLTMARLKTDPSTATDSMFAPAWSRYAGSHEFSRETMLTHFAKAALWQMKDSDLNAIIEYDKVADYPDKKVFRLYKGLSCLNMTSLYLNRFNKREARKYIDRSKNHFQELGSLSNLATAYYSSGLVYCFSRDYDAALKEFDISLDYAEKTDDDELENCLMVSIAYTLSLKGHHKEAVEKFDAIKNNPSITLEPADKLAYSRSLMAIGDIPQAISLCESVSSYEDKTVRADYFYTSSKIYDKQGDYGKSKVMLDSFLRIEDQGMEYLLNSDINGNVHESQIQSNGKVLEKSGRGSALLVFIVSILFSILLLVALISMSRRWWFCHNRNEKADDSKKVYFGIVANMAKEICDEKSKSCNSVLAIESAEKELKILKGIIREREVAHKIDEVALDCYLRPHREIASICNDCKNVKIYGGLKAYQDLRSGYIEKYKDSQYLHTLINEINCISGNFLSRLKSDNRIKDQWLILIVYDICGFNYTSIAELMDLSEKNCSSIKTRCKKTLISIIDEGIDEYKDLIPMLNKRKSH